MFSRKFVIRWAFHLRSVLIIDSFIIFGIWQWEIQLASYTKEAEWSQAKYVPSFDQYIENAQVSVGVATVLLIAILFTGEGDILSQIHYRSKFLHLTTLTARLANDIKTYQVIFKTKLMSNL